MTVLGDRGLILLYALYVGVLWGLLTRPNESPLRRAGRRGPDGCHGRDAAASSSLVRIDRFRPMMFAPSTESPFLTRLRS